ncbi:MULTISPECIES: hypothetical protein [unclassified Caballeronia]|uniref:hypothetical protein n=1 Tax=unclassified Caballeronia TaxID=2646786 RepID=UPI00285CF350|nr:MULTISPECIES: hypothetical protein [unclassified Caballeronia]MDR5774924.1 hypothetical protein [Caballeronia sp. LZ002]MDR5801216.1 hypothetical protein [Caballeronia sp. LZ001]MDR5850360.1 hypothetical protein [Caballeronia sp. LZ003]
MTLIVSAATFLYIALVGGNPYHAGPAAAFDEGGTPRASFHRGEWMYVRRNVCLDRDIYAEQSPSLYDVNRKAYIALRGTATLAKAGCAVRSSAFEIPATLPPGDYEYRNVSRFQNNLVGRDESNVYPPIRITVTE